MQSEVTVTLKGEDGTFKKPFSCYDQIRVEEDCPTLQDLVKQTKDQFNGEVEEVIVKITTKWK
jgi:hypothetical protein